MPRLPQLDGDNGTWGQILNDFLQVAHDASGNLADNAVTNAKVADGTITPTKLNNTINNNLAAAQSAVQNVNGKTGPTVTLNASDVATSPVVAGGATVQAALEAIDGTVLAGIPLWIQDEQLSLTDPRIGMVANSPNNQGELFQTAINLAGNAIGSREKAGIFVPPGDFKLAASDGSPIDFTFVDGRMPVIRGAAPAPHGSYGMSNLIFPDPGAGKYALRFMDSTNPNENAAHPWLLSNVSIIGPGSGVPYGGTVSQGYGVRFDGSGLATGVTVTGFEVGAAIHNDHQTFRDCGFSGNAYNMLWESTNGLGDQFIDRCRLEPASKASIGISTGAAILQATFNNCHLGNGPYGIYRFGSSGGRANAMDGVVMRNCSFEGFGNAAIYDEIGDAFFNITFLFYGEGSSLTGGTRWPGKPVRAAFDVGTLNATFIGRSASAPFDPTYSPLNPNGTGGLDALGNPIQRTAFRLNSGDIRLETAGYMNTYVNFGSLFFLPGDNVSSDVPHIRMTTPQCEADIIQLQTSVAQYDLLSEYGTSQAITYAGDAYAYPLGIAARAGNAGDWIAYYRKGVDGGNLRARLASGQSIGSGNLFKADPTNPGCVVQSASAADGPIVGRAKQGGGPGGSFEAELF
jgi:hypothetical protein